MTITEQALIAIYSWLVAYLCVCVPKNKRWTFIIIFSLVYFMSLFLKGGKDGL
jgi:hypothetical protein